ncbi:hypothetical protein [Nocardia cyriacigeorgica]|nr:hypothetical protein [Nocardia cyriacigeorgica]BDT88318.1 hypothetical protein FMUAM8_40820 [Nocardia cyriacigeorgica]BDU07729.1 hypothetical protein FMUBM48_39920 [Nocardia cyriacigeorgica]
MPCPAPPRSRKDRPREPFWALDSISGALPLTKREGGLELMSVVVYAVLTIALFAVLGLIQRGVERL